MEKIIIVGPKEKIERINPIKLLIASGICNILIIDPKKSEEKIKSLFLPDDTLPDKLSRDIGDFNKVLGLNPQEEIGDILSNQTPRYDRFIQKGGTKNNRTSKQQFKKKGNKRK